MNIPWWGWLLIAVGAAAVVVAVLVVGFLFSTDEFTNTRPRPRVIDRVIDRLFSIGWSR